MAMIERMDLEPELRGVAESELSTRERVLWSGRPRPGRFVLGALPIFLFAIPWTAFAVFWTAMALQAPLETGGGWTWLFPLWGLPFILIGLCMLASPLWARRRARRTLYLITDRRAILFEGGWSITVRSFAPDQLTKLTRRQRSDGSGDIIIDRKTWRDSDGDPRSREVGFMGIEQVKEVEEMLRRLAANAPADPPEPQQA